MVSFILPYLLLISLNGILLLSSIDLLLFLGRSRVEVHGAPRLLLFGLIVNLPFPSRLLFPSCSAKNFKEFSPS